MIVSSLLEEISNINTIPFQGMEQLSKLEVKKIFLVRAKQQTNAYKNFREQLKKYFNEKQFSQVSIRENQDIINAMSEKLDIFTYKNSSNGAIDYRNLVDEFLEELK